VAYVSEVEEKKQEKETKVGRQKEVLEGSTSTEELEIATIG